MNRWMGEKISQLLRMKKAAAALALGAVLCLGFTEPKEKDSFVHDAIARPQLQEALGKVPMGFEANQGQVDPAGEGAGVKFLSQGDDYNVYITPKQALLALHPKAGVNAVVRMNLQGANPMAQVEGLKKQAGTANYFMGNAPAKWRSNVPLYAQVLVKEVYPGIDMVYYGNQRELEYDFVLKPGADPNRIGLRFSGDKGLKINPKGDLQITVSGGNLTFKKPVIYQNKRGSREAVQGRFVMTGKNQVRFKVADYDKTRALVIDPGLEYSTYLGGSQGNTINSMTIDSSGNVYVLGNTLSSNIFPGIVSPLEEAYAYPAVYVVKFNPNQSGLIYTAYFGGSLTSFGSQTGNSIAVDQYGCAYFTGTTTATNFPVYSAASYSIPYQKTNPSSQSAFVTKLNYLGTGVAYSTYLSGQAQTWGYSIAVNSTGNAFVAGMTTGGFPTTSNAAQLVFGGGPGDGFVAELDALGAAVLYGTYLGGGGSDACKAIALDSVGNAYVAGFTRSASGYENTGSITNNFPTSAGAYQSAYGGNQGNAFVTKLSTGAGGNGKIAYSTYLGGKGAANNPGIGSDCANAIAVDASGNAYVTGTTGSSNFPVTGGAYQTALIGFYNLFVSKLSAAGALSYSSYFGGSNIDYGNAIAVDKAGAIHVTGTTISDNFPTTSDAFQVKNPNQYDYDGAVLQHAFYLKLNPGGQGTTDLVYSTYLGGDHYDIGNAIAVFDSTYYHDVYLAGSTSSDNLPAASTTPFQSSYRGSSNNTTLNGYVAIVLYSVLGPDVKKAAGTATTTPSASASPSVTPTASRTATPTSTGSPSGASATNSITSAGGLGTGAPTVTRTATSTPSFTPTTALPPAARLAATATWTPTPIPVQASFQPLAPSPIKGKSK